MAAFSHYLVLGCTPFSTGIGSKVLALSRFLVTVDVSSEVSEEIQFCLSVDSCRFTAFVLEDLVSGHS